MIEVYRIPVSKEHLGEMSKDERVLLLLLGYASNQLSMLQKFLDFSTNRTPDGEIDQFASGVQTQMLSRLMVGVLSESWELVRTRFIRNPLAEDYLGRLDPSGLQAFDALKIQFGGSNLLNRLRNTCSFHFPRTEEVEDAFRVASENTDLDDCWNLYLSQVGFHSLFLISDLIVAQGIAGKVGGTDLAETHRKLGLEISTASANFFEFARAFVAAAWKNHFGTEMVAEMVTISDAPNIDEVWLPFFVNVGSGEQQSDPAT